MLIKTNKKDKNGKTIYAFVACRKETVMCGNNPVNVPGKLQVVKEGTLNYGGPMKGVKIPNTIFGNYKKPYSMQRGF